MANNNNIYFNAAYCGYIEGALCGSPSLSTTAASYLLLTQAAQAFAVQVDSKIPATDVLVSTGGGVTQLAITTNTIAANEQWRAGLLQALCRAAAFQRTQLDTTAAKYDVVASAIFAQWTEGLLLLVTP